MILQPYSLLSEFEKKLFNSWLRDGNLKQVAIGLNRASGKTIPANRFIETKSVSVPDDRINYKSVELHAFYNPSTDMTVYFLLPSRELMEKYQK